MNEKVHVKRWPSSNQAPEARETTEPVSAQHDVERATSNVGHRREEELGSRSSGSDLVDWKGSDDPELPVNWPEARKWQNIVQIAVMTLLTYVLWVFLDQISQADSNFRPFASSMFAPAIDQVMREMHTTNRDIGSFGVSIYLLGYAFGPLILAPCSELYGRLIVYHICTLLFILMNVACGLSISMPMLIVFRFLTGLVGACPLTLGPGSVSDLFKQEHRGLAMAVWTMPVLLGPCLGPAVGAYVSRALGWRWNFWLLIIMVSVIFCYLIEGKR